MNFTVYDGLYAYAKKANSGLYLECRTAIFNDPENQDYTPKGKITKIRQYESGKAGNYNKSKGWMQPYGTTKGVEWIDYRAPYDRAKVLAVDAVDELQSFANGMTPSIELLNGDFLNNQLPDEIDATNIARFFSRIPAQNKFTSTALPVDKDNIINTVLELENKIFSSGYNRDSVLFMSSKAYAAFQQAIISNHGFAGGAMIKRSVDFNIDTGLQDLMNNSDETLSVTVDFDYFGKFFIAKMPENRMYSHIIMLDGYSTGQERGGYLPDTTADGFSNIDLMAIPIEAAFTNTRYMIDNLLVPASMPGLSYTNLDLRKLNERMYGNIEVTNAGINQKANAFEYDVRIIYGGDLYDNRRRNCFAVYTAASDVKITSINLFSRFNTIDEPGGQLLIQSSVLPYNASNPYVNYSVDTLVDGQAEIDSVTGLLTAKANGTVTVTGTAADGSGVTGTKVITITNQ